MGNRCVITSKSNFENNGVGVYLHWNGGRDSVEAFLEYCKRQHFRAPDDSYGWARLVQVIANFFGPDGLSIGVDTVSHLDCDNWDNGVYIIDGWEIVDRKYFDGTEQNIYELEKMIDTIANKQPIRDVMGCLERYIMATGDVDERTAGDIAYNIMDAVDQMIFDRLDV